MKNQTHSHSENAQVKELTIERTREAAQDEVSKKIVMRHLNSFLDNNLEAVLSDYHSESVLITQSGTYQGPDEIRTFFTGLIIHFPQQTSNFALDKLVAKNGLVYIVWHAKTPSVQVPLGSDTFIIKDGKIAQQTFVGQLDFV